MPQAFTVIIGSTRPAKVEGARAAIDAIGRVDERFRRAVIQPMDVADVAPTMPMTERAILDGARLRAQTVLERTSGFQAGKSCLGVGVEGGLDPLPGERDRYVLKTWAAVTDGIVWGFGGGGAITLPDTITRQVLEGRELGDVIDAIAGVPVRGTRGAWGVLTRDLLGRQASFTSAILAALAPFYNAALYRG